MAFGKLNSLFDKNNTSNIIKIAILLIGLYILYRIFTDYGKNNESIEGFAVNFPLTQYGNLISLSDKKNIPAITQDDTNNKYIFELDSVYKIETVNLTFSASQTGVSLQFVDGSGNVKNIKGISGTSTNKLTSFNTTTISPFNINITKISDENDLTVFTSKIIVNYPKESTKTITTYAIYGTTRNMPSSDDFTSYFGLSSKMNKTGTTLIASEEGMTDIYTTKNSNTDNIDNDAIVYAFKINCSTVKFDIPTTTQPAITSGETEITSEKTVSTTAQTTTTKPPEYSLSPFELSFKYYNNIYPNNEFNIKTKYIVRNDVNFNMPSELYIYLDEPIIANKVVVSVPRTEIANNYKNVNKLTISTLTYIYKDPTTTDINNYKRKVNMKLQGEDSSASGDICPGLNDIADKQSKTQQICDNLEYQDKVRAEKLRLEKNKQYLLKLKQQQEQIDELNTVIGDLESKRQGRAQIADQVRLLNFQKQKELSSRVRDIANQRLQLQDLNKLYLDINVNNA